MLIVKKLKVIKGQIFAIKVLEVYPLHSSKSDWLHSSNSDKAVTDDRENIQFIDLLIVLKFFNYV